MGDVLQNLSIVDASYISSSAGVLYSLRMLRISARYK
jgi:hypothetical protein